METIQIYCPKCRSEVLVSRRRGSQCDSCALVQRPLETPYSYLLQEDMRKHLQWTAEEETMRLYGYSRYVSSFREAVDDSLLEVRA